MNESSRGYAILKKSLQNCKDDAQKVTGAKSDVLSLPAVSAREKCVRYLVSMENTEFDECVTYKEPPVDDGLDSVMCDEKEHEICETCDISNIPVAAFDDAGQEFCIDKTLKNILCNNIDISSKQAAAVDSVVHESTADDVSVNLSCDDIDSANKSTTIIDDTDKECCADHDLEAIFCHVVDIGSLPTAAVNSANQESLVHDVSMNLLCDAVDTVNKPTEANDDAGQECCVENAVKDILCNNIDTGSKPSSVIDAVNKSTADDVSVNLSCDDIDSANKSTTIIDDTDKECCVDHDLEAIFCHVVDIGSLPTAAVDSTVNESTADDVLVNVLCDDIDTVNKPTVAVDDAGQECRVYNYLEATLCHTANTDSQTVAVDSASRESIVDDVSGTVLYVDIDSANKPTSNVDDAGQEFCVQHDVEAILCRIVDNASQPTAAVDSANQESIADDILGNVLCDVIDTAVKTTAAVDDTDQECCVGNVFKDILCDSARLGIDDGLPTAAVDITVNESTADDVSVYVLCDDIDTVNKPTVAVYDAGQECCVENALKDISCDNVGNSSKLAAVIDPAVSNSTANGVSVNLLCDDMDTVNKSTVAVDDAGHKFCVGNYLEATSCHIANSSSQPTAAVDSANQESVVDDVSVNVLCDVIDTAVKPMAVVDDTDQECCVDNVLKDILCNNGRPGIDDDLQMAAIDNAANESTADDVALNVLCDNVDGLPTEAIDSTSHKAVFDDVVRDIHDDGLPGSADNHNCVSVPSPNILCNNNIYAFHDNGDMQDKTCGPAKRNRNSKFRHLSPRQKHIRKVNASPVKWSFILKSRASNSCANSAPVRRKLAISPITSRECSDSKATKKITTTSSNSKSATFIPTPCSTKGATKRKSDQLNDKRTTRSAVSHDSTSSTERRTRGIASSSGKNCLSTSSGKEMRHSRRLFSKQQSAAQPAVSHLSKSSAKSKPHTSSLHREITQSQRQSSQRVTVLSHCMATPSPAVAKSCNKTPSDSSDRGIPTKHRKCELASKSPRVISSTDSHETVAVSVDSRSCSASVRKKGPPARGLIWLKHQEKKQREQLKRKRNLLDDVTDQESDSDYEPSEQSSEGEDDSSDYEHTDSEDNTNQEGNKHVNQFGNDIEFADNTTLNDWHDVQGCQQQFDWVELCSIQNNVPVEAHKAIEFFELFCDSEVVEYMVTETNRYAHQTIQSGNVKQQSRLTKWTDTNAGEMKCFLGLLLWMGLVRMPTIAKYWAKSCLYRNSVSSVMTRNRFQLMLRAWHFADNQSENLSRIHKVDAFVKMLTAKFAAAKQPGQNVVIDESMVPFRGRLSFRQYIPGKSHKYGIKLFKLCDPTGYTYDINIYCGKEEKRQDDLATTVVMKLMEKYLRVGRTLCTDNFYTSIPLANKLLEHQTHLVGTLRSNRRGLPKAVVTAHLKKGEVTAAENDAGITVLKWKDKRDVMILSTKHTAEMINTGKKNRKHEEVIKPAAVLYYNQTKQGIDVSDQMVSYHRCLRKSIRWFHKVAMDILLGVAVVNSCSLLNERRAATNMKEIQITEFREQLCEHLLQHGQLANNSANLGSASSTSSTKHYLCATDQKQTGKRSDRRLRKYCIGCYQVLCSTHGRETARKKAKRVITECRACNAHYCFGCFPRYHKKLPDGPVLLDVSNFSESTTESVSVN